MVLKNNNGNAEIFRDAILFAAIVSLGACATQSDANVSEFAAYGYLSPNLSSTGELIGVYSSSAECEEAANAWTSRQVVGNPVRAECFRVDKN